MATPIVDPNKISVLVAGGAGAFLSMLFQRSSSKVVIFTTLVAAEAVDYYFAIPVWGLLHDNFSWADAQWEGPVAFTLGLLAIFIVGGLIKMASDFWGSPWKTISDLFVSVISRFLPGKKEK